MRSARGSPKCEQPSNYFATQVSVREEKLLDRLAATLQQRHHGHSVAAGILARLKSLELRIARIVGEALLGAAGQWKKV